jgi:predicted dehydrogenase
MRIGILSFAHVHTASYAACLRQIPAVELVGVADRDSERGKAAANQFGARYYDRYERLIAEKLDGVLVCSENSRHRELVELAAGEVPYILCEKPIAATIADAQAIINICTARGSKLQIAFPVRFSPAIRRLKEVLDQGKLGRIYAVNTTNHGYMPGGWFIKKELSGGGAVIDHTVHVIDLLRWFWGVEVTEVYAEVGYNLVHPGLGIDDVGLLSFKLSNGAFGTLDTSWSRPKSYATWGDVTIEVVGEKGVANADVFAQKVDVYSDAVGKGQWIDWGSDTDLGLMRDFCEMIAAGRAPSITGYDGLKALEVALAAYRSAEIGRPVRLPLA